MYRVCTCHRLTQHKDPQISSPYTESSSLMCIVSRPTRAFFLDGTVRTGHCLYLFVSQVSHGDIGDEVRSVDSTLAVGPTVVT